MPNRVPQNSYAAGELAPALHGRVDLAKFNVGLKRARNAYILVEGGASSRAGFRFLKETKDSTRKTRLIPFESGVGETYMLEFGHLYIRVYFLAGILEVSPGVPVEVVTPYTETDIFNLDYSQANDIMTLTMQTDTAVRELRRLTHTSWSLVTVSFAPTITPPSPNPVAVNTAGGLGGEQTQQYAVSTINAFGEESLPSFSNTLDNNLDAATDRITITWTAVIGATNYVVYKKRAGLFGFLGITDPGVLTIVDDRVSPNLGDTIKTDVQPFVGANNFPRTSFFYQQRRGFAGTINNPSSVWLTQLGLLYDFKKSVPSKATDGIIFTIFSIKIQDILHVVPIEDVMLFTPSTEWRIEGSAGLSAVEPPNVRIQSNYGSASIKPLVVGSDIVYVQASLQFIYKLNFSLDFNRYLSDDLTVLSRHMFKKRDVIGWCSSPAPFNLIWVHMNDGKMLALTFNREQEIYAWSQHDTQGTVESMASIREGRFDVVYAIVRRNIGGVLKRYVERMDERQFTRIEEAFFVDCGLSYNSPKVVNFTNSVTETLNITTHGLIVGDRVFVNGMTEKIPDGRYLVGTVPDANNITLTSLDGVLTDIPTNPYMGAGQVRKMASTFTGLGHLEGRTVVGLADGLVIGMNGELVVTGGSITIPFEAALVHIGLSYVALIETLELDKNSISMQGARKAVADITIRVEETRGLWVGPREDKLIEMKPRQFEGYFDPPQLITGLGRINLSAIWQDEVNTVIQQPYPLPMTILSTIPEIEYGN